MMYPKAIVIATVITAVLVHPTSAQKPYEGVTQLTGNKFLEGDVPVDVEKLR